MLQSFNFEQWAADAPDMTSVSPIFILLLAMGLNLFLGRESVLKRAFITPIGMTGQFLSNLQTRYNRPEYTDQMRRSEGISSLAVVITLSIIIGISLEILVQYLPFGWVPEAVLIAMVLALRTHFDSARVLATTLEHGTEQGRATLALFAARDTSALDRTGVCRAGIEITARTFYEGVVHPVVFYLLFGLPGLLVVRSISVFSRAIDERTQYGTCFGWASGRVNRLLEVPSLLVGPFIIALAVLLSGKPKAAGKVLSLVRKDAGKHALKRDGWAFASFAGALDVKLGGPAYYYGKARNHAWIGEHLRDAKVEDIWAARRLFVTASMVTAILVGVLFAFDDLLPLMDFLLHQFLF